MTEENNGTTPAGAGNPTNASSPFLSGKQNGGEQPGQEPKYLTEADAVQLFNRLRDGIADSISQKTANRVRRVLTAAQAQGVNLTAAQAQSLIIEMDAEAQQQQAQPQTASRGAPTQAAPAANQAAPEELHPVLQTAVSMMERAGVTIEEGDPELALIDQQTDDETDFLTSVKAAINAKKQRLAQELPARMPGLTSGGATKGGGKAALVAEYNELVKSPLKNLARIQEIGAELAKYK